MPRMATSLAVQFFGCVLCTLFSLQVSTVQGEINFADPVFYPTGVDAPLNQTVGDLNGDSIADVVVCHRPSGTDKLVVFLNAGDGTMYIKQTLSAQSGALGPAVADLDGDDDLDLAVANEFSDSVSVYINDGTGQFSLSGHHPVGHGARNVSPGDFDHDDDVDLAVSHAGLAVVTIMLNNGDGTFASPVDYSVPGGQPFICSGNLNDDLFPDIVMTLPPDKIGVLLNDGSGGFSATEMYSAGDYPWGPVVLDLDDDGFLDIFTSNRDSTDANVRINAGDGTFPLSPPVILGFTGTSKPHAGDIDSDGVSDVVIPNFAVGGFTVIRGDRQHDFEILVFALGITVSAEVAVADFNDDQKPDISLIDGVSDQLVIIINESSPPCLADVNEDGIVNVADLLIVLAQWGSAGPLGDVNLDGLVDVHDLLAVLAAWGPCS